MPRARTARLFVLAGLTCLGVSGLSALAVRRTDAGQGRAIHAACALAPGAPLAAPAAAPLATALAPQEGRLVALTYRAHPGLEALAPPEPMAPRGRWTRSPAGTLVWAPDWLVRCGLLAATLVEVDETEPEADPRIAPGTRGPHPVRRPRVVIMDPGGFSYAAQDGPAPRAGTGLARGLTGFGLWPEDPRDPGDRRDVLWVAFRLAGEAGPLLPAYAHELRHHHTQDWLGEGGDAWTPRQD